MRLRSLSISNALYMHESKKKLISSLPQCQVFYLNLKILMWIVIKCTSHQVLYAYLITCLTCIFFIFTTIVFILTLRILIHSVSLVGEVQTTYRRDHSAGPKAYRWLTPLISVRGGGEAKDWSGNLLRAWWRALVHFRQSLGLIASRFSLCNVHSRFPSTQGFWTQCTYILT